MRRNVVSAVSRRRLLRTEAVAQSPGGPTGAFLRVGSEGPRLVSRTQRRRSGSVAPNSFSGRHSEPSPGFRKRLYATATVQSRSDVDAVRHARIQRQALASPLRFKGQRALPPAGMNAKPLSTYRDTRIPHHARPLRAPIP